MEGARIPEISLMSAEDVAKSLHTTHGIVLDAILNGTMPIGAVVDTGRSRRAIIPTARYQRWVTGKDLGA